MGTVVVKKLKGSKRRGKDFCKLSGSVCGGEVGGLNLSPHQGDPWNSMSVLIYLSLALVDQESIILNQIESKRCRSHA